MLLTGSFGTMPFDSGEWLDMGRIAAEAIPDRPARTEVIRDQRQPDLHVLQPIAFDGIGPSQTCMNLCEAVGRTGAIVSAYGTRRRALAPQHFKLHLPFRNIGRRLPYRRSADLLRKQIEARMLEDIPPGAAVHVWPSLSLPTFFELKRRSCFIALELINILTVAEKRIIEDEMAREDFHYPHYVTDEKIRTQVRMLAGADLIFASNQNVQRTLLDYGLPPERIALTRYAATGRHLRDHADTDRPVFAFVGRVNMEKGVHHLLRAWQAAGIDGELRLYGDLDPNFAQHYTGLLNQPSVRLMGFHRDIASAYRSADAFIFLSLAEGGPLVSLEAAAHSLPMILSPMGAGRLAEGDPAGLIVDPANTAEVAAAIRTVAQSAGLRNQLGRKAYELSAAFSWDRAATERLAAIRTALETWQAAAAAEQPLAAAKPKARIVRLPETSGPVPEVGRRARTTSLEPPRAAG